MGLFKIVIASVLLAGTWSGCGGSSSSTATTDLSLGVSVATPTSANFSLPQKGFGAKVVEASTSGTTVTCEDTSGNVIGTGCTTTSDGTCTITGLTAAQLQAGVVVNAADANDVEIHAYRQYSSTETATTLETVPVNSKEDLAYSVTLDACGGTLGDCPATVDRDCLQEATTALIGDDTPSTSDLGGYAEAALSAMAAAHINATAGVNPSDLARQAIGGTVTGLADVAGTTTSTGSVPVVDAFTNFATLMDSIKTAYCDKTEGSSTWDTVKAAGTTAGETFSPKAVAGIFKVFQPTELGEYEVEDFRGYATSIPTITGGFQIFGDNAKARQTARNSFREGMFVDPTKAGVAMGMMAATFPEASGGIRNFDNFDPERAGQAARNVFLDYVDAAGGSLADSQTLFDKFGPALRDPTYMQAAATGGTAAFGDFVAGFVAAPGSFVSADFLGGIKNPPGGGCTTSTDCLPCDTCLNSICTSNSAKMGSSCTADSDCDDITTCTGGQNILFGGAKCMCKSGIPTGANVFTIAGQGPGNFGTTVTGPADGTPGGACGPLTQCTQGACSDSANGGVCLSATFKKGAFAPCSGGSECLSGTCTGNSCAPDASSAGTKANGQPCSAPSECASWFCCAHNECGDNLGKCSNPPSAFDGAFEAGFGDKAAIGAACTLNTDCASFFCQSAVCATPPSGGGAITGQPVGSPCFAPTECASLFCNFSSGNGGICQAL